MRIKASSANTKKSFLPQKQILSKKPTLVKCFICNQLFYTQDSFDSHWQQHQSKVNKNLPEQIQRKTIQSFGLKRKQSTHNKNSGLESINQNEANGKKYLSKTIKTPLMPIQSFENPLTTKNFQTKSSMLKKTLTKIDTLTNVKDQKGLAAQSLFQTQNGGKQSTEINEAIRQSSILITQINSIAEKYSNQEFRFVTAENVCSDHEQDSSSEDQIEKKLSQQEFIHLIKINNWSLTKIEQQMLKVNFCQKKSLQNYQIQVKYLRKLNKYASGEKFLQSIAKTKSKILSEVVSSILQSEIALPQNKNNQNKIDSSQILQYQNSQARTCSDCLDMISFGSMCIVQGDQSFHKECFPDKNKIFH